MQFVLAIVLAIAIPAFGFLGLDDALVARQARPRVVQPRQPLTSWEQAERTAAPHRGGRR